jgi:hypothetical protein
VATKITVHWTDRRYAIVSDADLREAAFKPAGTIPGSVAHLAIDQARQVRDNHGTGG